jgi:UDP-N-acetylmuramoyl-L-alanyl-D-glutamate--2,6-diaminopimelate ligase
VRLEDLLRAADLVNRGMLVGFGGSAGTEVTTITMDSRQVTPGSLFACVVGLVSDGHDFAAAAVRSGAAALLVERPLDLDVPQVRVVDVRAALGPLSDAFYDHPSAAMRVVGVTGTNGKTTTVTLLAGIFAAHGWAATSLGTLSGVRTTAEAPELQGRLADLRRSGLDAVAMEVSSHALDQRRVDGVRFAAGVLTNVTQDHLDYHHTMEAYFAAKARLFEPGRVEVAVVNVDDPYGRRLLEQVGDSVPTDTFSLADARDLSVTDAGSRFVWRGAPVELALRGRFNVANALAAATAAGALGIPTDTVAAGLASTTNVRGRFETVDAGQPFTVLVDYAHTPDGLAEALAAARELGTGRVIVVFGAGGDRDPTKRPLMGQVAAARADLSVVTSDNPRSEDPMAIIDDIRAGAAGANPVVAEPDRQHAIADALAAAGPGDVVLIAGKGHETGQDFGGRVEPFDDAAEARAAWERISGSRRRDPSAGGGGPGVGR